MAESQTEKARVVTEQRATLLWTRRAALAFALVPPTEPEHDGCFIADGCCGERRALDETTPL